MPGALACLPPRIGAFSPAAIVNSQGSVLAQDCYLLARADSGPGTSLSVLGGLTPDTTMRWVLVSPFRR